jgi:hypothetical protein
MRARPWIVLAERENRINGKPRVDDSPLKVASVDVLCCVVLCWPVSDEASGERKP